MPRTKITQSLLLTRQTESRLMQIANGLWGGFVWRSLVRGHRGHYFRCHSDLTHWTIVKATWNATQLSKLRTENTM